MKGSERVYGHQSSAWSMFCPHKAAFETRWSIESLGNLRGLGVYFPIWVSIIRVQQLMETSGSLTVNISLQHCDHGCLKRTLLSALLVSVKPPLEIDLGPLKSRNLEAWPRQPDPAQNLATLWIRTETDIISTALDTPVALDMSSWVGNAEQRDPTSHKLS